MSTNDLHQFLATIDYPEKRLILRPRNEESRKGLKNEFAQARMTELPFVLAMTHLMIGKGSINGREAMNIFFDSGLADSTAAVLLPKQTMELLCIALPATTETTTVGGLAGGGFPIGRFSVNNVGLGQLRQDSLQGIYGFFPPQLYHMCDFIVDGLISHQFLKKYIWTIDFDSMKMLFSL